MLIDTSSTNGSTAMLNPRYIPEMPRSTKVMDRTNKRNRTVEISRSGNLVGWCFVPHLPGEGLYRFLLPPYSFLLHCGASAGHRAQDAVECAWIRPPYRKLGMLWSGPGPELMPERMPDRMPDRRMPDRMPEYRQRGCQKDCKTYQIECLNDCQKDCKNICQKVCKVCYVRIDAR